MKSSGYAVVVGGFVILAVIASSIAADRDASLYSGTKSCRMCHKKAEKGDQFGKWKAGPHAKAFETLGTDEAKAVAKKLGIADAQKSGKCLSCHATSYDLTEEVKTEKFTAEEGVSCESCHGPGKNYKKKSVMQSREASVAAGMIYPAKQSCVLCHNEKSPTWKADRYTTKDGKKVGFDVDKAYEKIKHPNPLAKK